MVRLSSLGVRCHLPETAHLSPVIFVPFSQIIQRGNASGLRDVFVTVYGLAHVADLFVDIVECWVASEGRVAQERMWWQRDS